MGKKKKQNDYSQCENLEVDKGIFSDVIDYFINQDSHTLMMMQANRTSEELRLKITQKAEEQLRLRGITSEKLLHLYMETFEVYLWGYYKLDPLISDKSISDISCYAYNNVI